MRLFNEGYDKHATFFEKGRGSIVISKGKSFIDLSCGAGTLLLGHNSEIQKKSLKKYLQTGLSNFAHPRAQFRTISGPPEGRFW